MHAQATHRRQWSLFAVVSLAQLDVDHFAIDFALRNALPESTRWTPRRVAMSSTHVDHDLPQRIPSLGPLPSLLTHEDPCEHERRVVTQIHIDARLLLERRHHDPRT